MTVRNRCCYLEFVVSGKFLKVESDQVRTRDNRVPRDEPVDEDDGAVFSHVPTVEHRGEAEFLINNVESLIPNLSKSNYLRRRTSGQFFNTHSRSLLQEMFCPCTY
jgi:hypothetical protein